MSKQADVTVELHTAFVETAHDGFMDKALLPKCLSRLGINLHNPKADVDAIWDSVDKDGKGVININDFEARVKPKIDEFKAKGYPLIIDELIREAFKAPIHDAEEELSWVDRAFILVHSQMVKEDHGFGVKYWGESWRFKMFDDFYENPRDENGAPVPRRGKVEFLKKRLREVAAGDQTWIQKVIRDPKIEHELPNEKCWAGVKEYATRWLKELDSKGSFKGTQSG